MTRVRHRDLTDTYTGVGIAVHLNRPQEDGCLRGMDLPDRAFLEHIRTYVTSEPSEASRTGGVTWYLSTDRAGRHPITDEVESPWVHGANDEQSGGWSGRLEIPHVASCKSSELYYHVRFSNAGDDFPGFDFQTELRWRVDAAVDLTEDHRRARGL